VILTENLTKFVSQVVSGDSTVLIRARAIATMRTGAPACILGLNPSVTETVLFRGGGTTTLSDCVVQSNSTHATGFAMNGASVHLTTDCVLSSGGSAPGVGLVLTECMGVTNNHPQALDPYADVPAPSPIPSCGTMPTSGDLTAGGGVVCYNGMNFTNPGTSNLAAGTYVVNGGTLTVSSTTVLNGSGVMFYLTNGAKLQIEGGATMNLTAPTSGTYSGLLFFGDRTQPTAINTVQGAAVGNLKGAFYFPSQTLRTEGSFIGTSGCMQVIADRVDYAGSATFNSNCSGSGVKEVITVGDVKLVE
jgi:hypothetical protein